MSASEYYTSSSSSESSEGNSAAWDDWVEEDDTVPTTCLFCDFVGNTVASVLSDHMPTVHAFVLEDFARSKGLSFYELIKVVNLVRRDGLDAAALQALEAAPLRERLGDDGLLQPTLAGDALLFNLPGMDDDDDDAAAAAAAADAGNGNGAAGAVPSSATAATAGGTEMSAEAAAPRVADLEARLAVSEEMLMRAREMLVNVTTDAPVAAQEEKDGPNKSKSKNNKNKKLDSYFQSYSTSAIHEEMIKDKVRTESYMDAIEKNKDAFAGKIVLDVGCGSGILSLFAARAGAAKVYAIDRAEIIAIAREIAEKNGFKDRIVFLEGRVEDLELPVPTVDIIVSEWMGYCLLYESMMPTVLLARQRWLAKGGRVLPNKAHIVIMGVEAEHKKEADKITFWNDVYGLNFSPMIACQERERVKLCEEAHVTVVNAELAVTDTPRIHTIDLETCSVTEHDFSKPFTLTPTKDTTLEGLVVYFDIDFDDLPHPVTFSTGPQHTTTHWAQTHFHLKERIPLVAGKPISGTFALKQRRDNFRHLDLTIAIGDQKAATYWLC